MNEPNKQLQDALDYACALGRFLAGHDLIFRFTGFQKPKATQTRHIHINGDGFEGVQRDAFIQVFNECGGNLSAVHRKLRVSRATAYGWKKRFLCVLPLLLLFCGCGAPKPTASETPQVKMLSMPAVTNRAAVPFVQPPLPNGLGWNNPNDTLWDDALWIDIWASTNAGGPFSRKIFQFVGSNTFVFRPATNFQEYAIARYAFMTRYSSNGIILFATNYSDWNQ